MASKVERTCKTCRGTFLARTADVKRGWGLFCSKTCKGKEQENRTNQFSRLLSHWNGPLKGIAKT
jgi:hypothetical protein